MISFVVCAVLALAALSAAKPDDGETITTPGPGLSYGKLNLKKHCLNKVHTLRQYERQRRRSSSEYKRATGATAYLNGPYGTALTTPPIEQYLR
ncbi:hypothetical protein SFRURICE_015930 [Spodoptera frugiperda]|nr:hypothetical protein SFRURICE_015930 [Spodoptera frugiperda]